MRTAPYVTPETIDAKIRGWLEDTRGRVAPRPHLRLDPDRCALLVVDMVRYFAAPEGRCHLPAADAVTPRIAALVDAWRRFGGAVAFSRHGHEGAHDLGMLGRFFSDYIHAGEPESAIVPALAPREGELVFRKTTYDALLDTPLEGWLRERGVEQVLVTGVLTHMCCETTARSAFCRGFEVYVPVDATASKSEELHVNSLRAMADAVAVPTSIAEVLARCAERR